MVAQKITIEPVTRIEGHAKVTIQLNDQGNGFGRQFLEQAGLPMHDGLTREQLQQMTPRQRQQIIEARRQLKMLERQRQINARPSVTPPRQP